PAPAAPTASSATTAASATAPGALRPASRSTTTTTLAMPASAIREYGAATPRGTRPPSTSVCVSKQGSTRHHDPDHGHRNGGARRRYQSHAARGAGTSGRGRRPDVAHLLFEPGQLRRASLRVLSEHRP